MDEIMYRATQHLAAWVQHATQEFLIAWVKEYKELFTNIMDEMNLHNLCCGVLIYTNKQNKAQTGLINVFI